MNYRKFSIILISIIIGSFFGWFANLNFNNTDSKNVQNTTISTRIVKTEIQKKDVELQDIDLNELDSDCSKDILSLHPLIVQYAENASCNCDSAYTNLEINFCSSVNLCIERNQFDKLNKQLLKVYDSLIVWQNKEIEIARNTNDSIMLEYVIDYKSIKELHKKSIKLYLEYLELETEIQGIKVGKGRERSFWENSKALEILKMKNKELAKLIKEED